MRSIVGPIGHMIVCAEREPTVEEQFLAQVVAQQTGVAVSNARLHARERASALELARTNAALQETVATLRAACRSTSASPGSPPPGRGRRASPRRCTT
jgi:hypothetical protein